MLSFIILFLIPSDSYAYLDPVTGSVVVQAVIAAYVTGIFFIKMYWKKITSFVKKVFGKKEIEKEVKKDDESVD